MKEFFRKLYYQITRKETKWDLEYNGKEYVWKKLRLPLKKEK